MNTYIETYSGRKIDFFNPDPKEIVLEDIVRALRAIPRFGGHTKHMYSVMAHSLNVAALVPAHLKYEAILHDAAEAYVLDMPTPFKLLMPEYKALENRVWNAICVALGVNPQLSPEVKYADKVALMTERDQLKPFHGVWEDDYEEVMRAPFEMFAWGDNTLASYLKIIAKYKEMYAP